MKKLKNMMIYLKIFMGLSNPFDINMTQKRWKGKRIYYNSIGLNNNNMNHWYDKEKNQVLMEKEFVNSWNIFFENIVMNYLIFLIVFFCLKKKRLTEKKITEWKNNDQFFVWCCDEANRKFKGSIRIYRIVSLWIIWPPSFNF